MAEAAHGGGDGAIFQTYSVAVMIPLPAAVVNCGDDAMPQAGLGLDMNATQYKIIKTC